MMLERPILFVTAKPHTVLGWHVDDIEATVAELAARGVRMLRYDHVEQDEDGIWLAGDAKIAWFHDPDGNVLSLTSWA